MKMIRFRSARVQISSLLSVGAFLALTGAMGAKANAFSASPVSPPPAPQDGKTFACGGDGQPKCPMQAWMKANMAPAAAGGDGAALAKAMDYVASHSPPGFSNWTSIAKDAADKARAGDLDTVKKACKTCHDQYKAKYKAEMRDRPF
jgi:hypothetical protein